MRVLICGDRDWTEKYPIYLTVEALYKKHGDNLVIINGLARGADSIADEIARKFLPDENVLGFPADWTKYKKAAGPIRNKQMLIEGQPDLVISFHQNIEESKGTKNMVEQSRKASVPVVILRSQEEAEIFLLASFLPLT